MLGNLESDQNAAIEHSTVLLYIAVTNATGAASRFALNLDWDLRRKGATLQCATLADYLFEKSEVATSVPR